MKASKIEWTEVTWNPVRGCSRVSPGCQHCFAEVIAARFSGPGLKFEGFAERTKGGARWTNRVDLVREKVFEPLKWRTPRTVFVNSMSDLFHEALPAESIAATFGVMAATPHTYQVLTKRPRRMAEWLLAPGTPEQVHDTFELATGGQFAGYEDQVWPGWPLPNVWLGVSIESQTYAEERLPLLQLAPAALRFASAEPLLGPLDLDRHELGWGERPWLDWLIAGGESGPGARPIDLAWFDHLVAQADAAGRPIFVKQLGAAWAGRRGKGGDPAAWPANLRRRAMPPIHGAAAPMEATTCRP